MGLFRKPVRPLDRLPSRFRPHRAGGGRGEPPGLPARARGPGNGVTLLIFLCSAALLAVTVVLWRTGLAGPQAASGEPPTPRATAPGAETVVALLTAAKSYADQQDFLKAEAILRAAVNDRPDDQELRIALGETLMRQKKPADAYEQYSRALAIGPREPRVEFIAGTLASQTGRLDQAAEHYRAAQAGDPSAPQYPLYLAQVQIKQEKIEDAKVNLLLSIKLNPQEAVAWGTLADIFLRQNKLDLAIKNVARARELQPQVTVWKLIEARALARQGAPQKALLLLTTLDPSERRSPQVLSLMAECYGLLRRPADAARLYADASDATPTDADLAFAAATWADRSGDRQAALRFAERAAQNGYAGAKTLLDRLRG